MSNVKLIYYLLDFSYCKEDLESFINNLFSKTLVILEVSN